MSLPPIFFRYLGEIVDNTLSPELDGWDTIGYSEPGKHWAPAVPYTALVGRQLVPTPLDPIVRLGPLAPGSFTAHGGGRFSWGFDQNFAGFTELDVPATGFANTTLIVEVGEETDAAGWPSNGHSWWSADGTLRWTLRGERRETLRQTFMFMGFQFIGVSGWPVRMEPPTIDSMRGVPTSTLSTAHRVGELIFDGITPSASIADGFRRSSVPAADLGGTVAPSAANAAPTVQHRRSAVPPATNTVTAAVAPRHPSAGLNATILAGVFHLIVWGQLSNFQSIPSDCPNREKHGWMGDAQVSAMGTVANFDAAAAYRSWVRAMLDNQGINLDANSAQYGAVNSIVPPGDWPIKTADASWGLAIGEVPYQLLRQYGDVTLVQEAYAGIRAYWQFLKNHTDSAIGLMVDQAQWGDWDAAFDRKFYQPNSMVIGATSAHMRLAQILAEIAPVAGESQDVSEYTDFLALSRPLYNAYYQNKTHPFLYVDGVEQTVTLLPLSLGFVPDVLAAQAQAWLINDLEHTRGMHLSTGATGILYWSVIVTGFLGNTCANLVVTCHGARVRAFVIMLYAHRCVILRIFCGFFRWICLQAPGCSFRTFRQSAAPIWPPRSRRRAHFHRTVTGL